ncbi:MAG: DUF1800 family protein [Terrimicrobiaceae bacterium]
MISAPCLAVLDENGNQQSDVWEMLTASRGLFPDLDQDGDGFTNREESVAGTHPRDAGSFPSQSLDLGAGSTVHIQWPSFAGKLYHLEFSNSLVGGVIPWQVVRSVLGKDGMEDAFHSPSLLTNAFYRVRVGDVDTDEDGVSDWEELSVGFDPALAATDRYSWLATPPWQTGPYRSADYHRIKAGLSATNIVSAVVVDAETHVDWPDPAVIALRRTGGLGELTIPVVIGGTAVRGVDYDSSVGSTVTIPAGVREVPILFTPRGTSTITSSKTITLTLQTSSSYSLGATSNSSVTLRERPADGRPSAKAAARFLVQAAFGPDSAEIARVQALGFEGWINDQFSRPVGWHQPDMEALDAQIRADNPGDPNRRAWADDYAVPWWNQAMKPGPTADPLRQRVAYALSQILVISDRVDAIGFYPAAMANYYDMLLRNAFGNYRTLLYETTLHPCMGAYLSHMRNAKEDPARNLFPDENYAREVMQLFSIGLWQLNPDGTRQLDGEGRPIPSYTNDDIRNFSKVFTGLALKKRGGSTAPDVRTADWFYWTDDETYEGTMEMWDRESWVYRADRSWIKTPEYYHDRTAKPLLNGVVLPANQRGLKDIEDAISNLVGHPNSGPFISRLLIQRFVTSNPSPEYLGRVAAVFTANISNPWQMREVIKAILLDPEARDPASLEDETFGKQREPYLRIANLMKAFGASAPSGKFELRYLDYPTAQRPLHSPSVFNFYLPDYQPPGEMAARGLYGPEFQITTDITAISNPNYAMSSVTGWREWQNNNPTPTYHQGDFNLWGSYYPVGDPRRGTDLVRPNYTAELALASDPAALLRRLDLLMTYGGLSARQHQIIREALERITPSTHSPQAYPNDYLRTRVETAIYLISISPEFCILQ